MLRTFLLLGAIFLSVNSNAEIFNVPAFEAPTEISNRMSSQVTAFLHVYCSYDKRSLCDKENPEANKVIKGKIDASGLVSFPAFNFDLQRPSGCSFLLSNCKPHLNINIFFTQYKFDEMLVDRVLNFNHGYTPYKPKGHTVLNAGHYALNRSNFSEQKDLEENITYFKEEYLPYVRIFENENADIEYQYVGPVQEF